MAGLSKVMKEKNLQPRLLYAARISFKYEGEIRSFTDKQKLREFSTTKASLQQMLKGSSLDRKHRKAYKLEPKITKQMATGLYLSIITLNVNELNAPLKRQRLAEWKQKQDPYIYCTTANQGTHTD